MFLSKSFLTVSSDSPCFAVAFQERLVGLGVEELVQVGLQHSYQVRHIWFVYSYHVFYLFLHLPFFFVFILLVRVHFAAPSYYERD